MTPVHRYGRGTLHVQTSRPRMPILVCALLLAIPAGPACRPSSSSGVDEPVAASTSAPGTLRLSGTVEAADVRTIAVPRLQGPAVPLLVIDLVKAGTRVEAGDLLVQFDRQQQERDAFDRQAELVNLEGEIAKKRGEQGALEAKDRAELDAAGHDVERASLEVRKNELIARVEAEKNTLALEQARARLEQLRLTYTLKREAAAADLRILEIRRDRAARALDYARGNARLMEVRAPFAGLAVIKRVYRNGAFVEIAKGDEVRPGTAIVDIVDTAKMLVRARVNQADGAGVRAGQRARVGLDGFPELAFDGRVEQITPLAAASQLTDAVRSFTALIAIEGSHPQLLPDLTAWVDLETAPLTAASEVPVP